MSGDQSIRPAPVADPAPPVTLSAEENEWLVDLPFDLALMKIAKNHYNERCANCNRFIGAHTLKQNRRCLHLYNKRLEGTVIE